MKFMIPFLMAAVLPAAGLAQSQSGGGSGVPSIAIPKTTEVIVIETPKQGITPQQVMAVIPEEIKATVKLWQCTRELWSYHLGTRHISNSSSVRQRSVNPSSIAGEYFLYLTSKRLACGLIHCRN